MRRRCTRAAKATDPHLAREGGERPKERIEATDGPTAGTVLGACCTGTYGRILRRMPRMQVYLPDELYQAVKRSDLPASELLQAAVRAEVERRELLAASEKYTNQLSREVGSPTPKQKAQASALARRIGARPAHRKAG